MSPLIELFAWICLGWAFVMSTGLFILEGINYRKNEQMRRRCRTERRSE